MAKIKANKLTDAEIDRLLNQIRYGAINGRSKAEAKKLVPTQPGPSGTSRGSSPSA